MKRPTKGLANPKVLPWSTKFSLAALLLRLDLASTARRHISLLSRLDGVFYNKAVGTVCLGSTKNLSLCWGLHGDTRSVMVYKGSASYIVPGCMTLKPRRARCKESSNCQHKVHWARCTCEMGCTIIFSKFVS